ncbi:MAG: formimidoylglutamase [Balneolaceae bacterium]
MSDKRLSDYIKPEQELAKPRVVMICFPSDEGVKRNGGRPGASDAPKLILEQLMKLTPHPAYHHNHTKLLETVSFCEPISCSGDVESDQELLGETVGSLLKDEIIPVVIGGGHETSFGHFLGYANAHKPVHILNIDAHADVRPLKNGKAHSGSPFRQSIGHPSGLCKSYNVFGLNPASISADHYNYVNEHGKAIFKPDVTSSTVPTFLDQRNNGHVMATMDMDAVNQADAPGVSAPNSAGLSADMWLNCAFEFGKSRAVRSFDICEVNPRLDRDHQTVKLAAYTLWNFLLGLSFR